MKNTILVFYLVFGILTLTSIVFSQETVDSTDTAKVIDSSKTATSIEKSKKQYMDKTKYDIENEENIYTFKKKGEEYRSPKKALFISFLIPGLGQAWAKDWKRGMAFLAVDFGILGFVLHYSAKGKDKMDDAYAFADVNWDKKRYDDWKEWLEKIPELGSYYSWIVDTSGLLPHDSTFNDAYKRKQKGDEHDYYEIVGKYEQFVPGWDDAVPRRKKEYYYSEEYIDNPYLDSLAKGTPSGIISPFYDTLKDSIVNIIWDENAGSGAIDTTEGRGRLRIKNNIYFGKSGNRIEYMKMRKEANDQYKIAVRISFLFLLNHLAAGIDAALTAKKYNDKIRNIKTFWDKLDIKVENDVQDYTWYQGIKVNYHF